MVEADDAPVVAAAPEEELVDESPVAALPPVAALLAPLVPVVLDLPPVVDDDPPAAPAATAPAATAPTAKAPTPTTAAAARLFDVLLDAPHFIADTVTGGHEGHNKFSSVGEIVIPGLHVAPFTAKLTTTEPAETVLTVTAASGRPCDVATSLEKALSNLARFLDTKA